MLSNKSAFGLFLVATLCVVSPSCGTKSQALVFPIGEKVQVGKLHYQVVDAQWKAEASGMKEPPKNRVLQVHFTVTNSAGGEVSIPLLRLIDADGKEIAEIAEIEGNPKWMGLIRRLQPAITEEGLIYFDVPVGSYKLEVVDNSEGEDEKVALIEIPASLAPPPAAPGSGGI